MEDKFIEEYREYRMGYSLVCENCKTVIGGAWHMGHADPSNDLILCSKCELEFIAKIT